MYLKSNTVSVFHIYVSCDNFILILVSFFSWSFFFAVIDTSEEKKRKKGFTM
jgi:hypothetical protein